MAKKALFAKQTISGFASESMYGGLYARFFYFPESGQDSNLIDPFSIEVGETYYVDWDGTEHEVVAQDSGEIIPGSVVLGNASDFGLSGNNEPFAILWTDVDLTFASASPTDTATSHTVGIYQEVAEDETEGGHIGNALTAMFQDQANAIREGLGEGIGTFPPASFASKIREINKLIGTGDGGSDLELLEGVPVEVDFSEGDFTLSAPDGYAVKSATVFKPDTLIPENILSGVNIAGVIGTAVAGGGGETAAVLNIGTFRTSSSPTVQTVTHGLGCKPDILIAYATGVAVNNQISNMVGFSKAFCTAHGLDTCGFVGRYGWSINTFTIGYDSSDTRNQYIHDIFGFFFADNDTTFQIGPTSTSQATLRPSTDYNWLAIGFK